MKKKSSPLKKGDISVNKRSSSAKPKKQPLAESDESEIIGPGSGGGFHLSPRALSMSSVQSGSGVQGGNSSSGSPDLDIDSDNTAAFAGPARSQEEDDMEDNLSLPGKMLMVNDGDIDANGVPNFADGIYVDANFDTTLGDGGKFVPLVLQLAKPFDDDNIRVKVTYAASDPANLSRSGDPATGYTFETGGGVLRIWTVDGDLTREAASVDQDGHFVKSGFEYKPSDLGFVGENDTVTFFLEAVAITPDLNDEGSRRITVETIRITGEGAPKSLGKDAVLVSVIGTALARVDENNNVWQTSDVEISYPSPVINLSQCEVTAVTSPGPGYQFLYGQLYVGGEVKSAVCDSMERATITEVKVFVNDLETAVATLNLSTSKDVDADSLARPFDFTGEFNQSVNVEVEIGDNLIRVEAVDPLSGIKGYTEYLINVTGEPPIIIAVASGGGAAAAPPPPPPDGYYSFQNWTFAGPSGTGVFSGTLSQKSNGGTFNPYLIEFRGPSQLVQQLESVSVGGVERRLKRYGDRIFLGIKQDSQIVAEIAQTLLAIHSQYNSDHQRDVLTLDYYQGFVLGFFEGLGALICDLGSLVVLAVKYNPIVLQWRFIFGDRFDEERQFLMSTYKGIEQLVTFWVTWRNRTIEDILTQDPDADPVEVALRVVSEDHRLFGEIAKAIIVYLAEKLQGMDAFDRGRLEGRIAFEIVTLIIAEVKAGQAAKITKLKELGLLQKIRDKIDDAINSGKIASGDAALAQKIRDAMAASVARVREFSKTGKYSDLNTVEGYNRHHLYQDAAVKPKPTDPPGLHTIPTNDGLCVLLKGSTRQKGSPHWKFHTWLEKNFWAPRRTFGDPLFGKRPTYAEYDQALEQALRQIFDEVEVQHLMTKSRDFRLNLGPNFADNVEMPRIPNKMNEGILPPE